MSKDIKIVIGANFGDEGKGLMTDYFCHQLSQSGPVLNVRFNGGAQAGHTVVAPTGDRHVFSHFGSGSFNRGVSTYLTSDFIANPFLFWKEANRFDRQYDYLPKIYIDKKCRITTPYDMLINQIIERVRGEQRHGSCGVGINETVERYADTGFWANKIQWRVGDMLTYPALIMLDIIRKDYLPERLKMLGVENITTDELELINNRSIADVWAEQLFRMLDKCVLVDGISDIRDYDGYVFEGAQGLLLDQDYLEFAPHLTSSKTGCGNAVRECLDIVDSDSSVEVCYVSRSYFTRHGAGPFPTECKKEDILPSHVVDATNHENEYQGKLRYGMIEWDRFRDAIENDYSNVDPLCSKCNVSRSAAFTHLDETEGKMLIKDWSYVAFDSIALKRYHSTGPTRNNVERVI